MISAGLLRAIGIVFALAALLATAVWLASALRNLARQRRLATRGPAALDAVALVLRGADSQTAVEPLRALGPSASIGLLTEMAGAVGGAQRRRLDTLAREIGLIAKANAWSGSRRWSRRLRAARLIAYFGEATDAAGPKLLADPNSDVRAEAALWAGRHRDPESLRRLVELLEDPAPRCRFNASEGLRAAGAAAAAVVGERLARAPEPPRQTILVARSLAVPDFHARAASLTRSADPATRAAAAALVAAIGGGAAGPELEALLDDPDAAVRAQAARGLAVLGRWEATAAVAELLGDPSWSVRRASAEALRRLGPTGELFLRRSGRGESGRGVLAARSVLGLPPEPALASRAAEGAAR